MSIKLICKLFYVVVHTLYSVAEFCIYLGCKFVDIYHELVTPTDRYLEFVKVEKLNKIPIHLTILLGSEKPSCKDLANLVLWCIAIGISFISFYDYKGILKENEAELMYEVNKRKRLDSHIIWHDDSSSKYKNGFICKKIHVKVLTDQDGREGVVNLCKELALSGKNKDISIDNVNNSLKNYYEFPDPDLGIYFGKTFSLYGYPPWQIRITEFLNLNSHHNITVENFLNLLQRYNRCEQRLGK